MQFQMVRGPKPLFVVSIDTESVLERADLQEWVEDKWRKNKGAGIPDYISASQKNRLPVLRNTESFLVKQDKSIREEWVQTTSGAEHCQNTAIRVKRRNYWTVQNTAHSLSQQMHTFHFCPRPPWLPTLGSFESLRFKKNHGCFFPLCCYLGVKDFHFWIR